MIQYSYAKNGYFVRNRIQILLKFSQVYDIFNIISELKKKCKTIIIVQSNQWYELHGDEIYIFIRK